MLASKVRLTKKRDNFPFAPHQFIIQRIVKDLELRVNRKFGYKHREALLRSRKNAQALLNEGPQGVPLYKKTVRYVMYDYLPTLDLILLERHPELKGKSFHKDNAEHILEKILSQAPDMFVHFSFAWVDDGYFVDTRPRPMNLIGITNKGLDDVSDAPYGDKYHMLISEFAWHDWGHAEFTSMRDLLYIQSSGKDLNRIVMEWEHTRLRMKSVVDQVAARDPVLAESMVTILFELLRERGFQFSLSVLKQELETVKWTRVLKIKLDAKFYDYYGTNKEKFERLEEARVLLVKAVERFKEEDQISWAASTRAHFVPAKLTWTPALTFAAEKLKFLEIKKSGSVIFHSENNFTPIRELISAQVSPTRNSPLSKDIILKIEKVLNLPEVVSVNLKGDKTLWVAYADETSVNLQNIQIPKGTRRARKLENAEIFEMNQVLGTEERGELAQFTVRPPTQTYVGTVKLDKNFITGFHTATIKTLDGETVTVPLVELRIDPL
ncbi:MAG: hypothetical protein ACK5V3_10190 [Bdellovibrionales bacterium]